MSGHPATGEAGVQLEEAEALESAQEGGWNYDEVHVRLEREEGIARTEKAKKHIQMQQRVWHNITAKLSEHAQVGAVTGPRSVGHLASPCGSPRGSSSQHEGGCSSPEQQRSAHVVAGEILRHQERLSNFKKRRLESLEKERCNLARNAEELEAADAKTSQRMHEMVEQQRRRAFASQQRRSEQQKVLRESRREQERQWEAFYTKNHPSPKGLPTSPKGMPSSPSSSQLGGRSPRAASCPAELEGEPDVPSEEDDILRSTTRSHNMYLGTMERWRQFVSDNERRTEAHWRKVMPGSSGNTAQEDQSPTRLLRSKVAEVIKMRRINSRARPEARSRKAEAGGSASPSQDSATLDRWLRDSDAGSSGMLSPGGGSPKGAFSSRPSRSASDILPQLNTWENRMQHCAQVLDRAAEEGREKLERKHEMLREARQRNSVVLQERSGMAAKHNRMWMERNDAASARRSDLGAKSDEHLSRKDDDFSRRRSTFLLQQEDLRSLQRTNKKETTENILAASRRLLQNAQETTAAKIKDKERQSMLNYQAKLQMFEESQPVQHMEQARAKLEIKQKYDEEKKQSAAREIERKQSRSSIVLSGKTQSTLRRHLSVYKERRSTGTLRIPRASLEGFAPGSASGAAEGEEGDVREHLGAAGEVEELEAALAPGASEGSAQLIGGPEGAVDGTNGRRSIRGSLKKSVPDFAGPREEEAPPVPPAQSEGGDEEDEERGAFLEAMEQRGHQWIQDMRRNKAEERPW